MLITVDKKNEEEVTKSKESPIINMPIVVLVNENTASASEMLTGALQDNQKAKVVGTTTYGKGVIQELYTLKDGSGLKITIKEYYTPNKNKINKTGIKPDYEVEYSKTENSDTQVEKAIELLK
jgi:carboxyl-terminal processing protease